MMLTDKKKPATLIIARMKGDKEKMEPAEMSQDGAEQDDSMAKESAAEELLSAIKAGNAKAVAEAFSAMMELCDYEEPESEQESSEVEPKA